MNFKILLVGLIVLAIGVGLTAAIFTQKTVGEGDETTIEPGILPMVLPTSLFNIPTFGIGAAIALIGVGLVIWGFRAF